MDEILEIILGVLLLGGILALVIYSSVNSIKKRKQEKALLNNATEPKTNIENEDGFGVTEIKATVIDLNCFVKVIGSKTPETVKGFNVVFETEDKRLISFSVPEEMYEGFEKGQTGILSFTDKFLYSFDIDN